LNTKVIALIIPSFQAGGMEQVTSDVATYILKTHIGTKENLILMDGWWRT